MNTITPLSNSQQQLIIRQTRAYINQAVELFDVKIKPVEIAFNLKGLAAGMYRVKYRKKYLSRQVTREIRYNPFIFSRYYDDNFSTTIPHEVAHYVCDMIHGLKNIKPHGREWKEIMQAFGAESSVTARYDLTGIPRKKQATFAYFCNCGTHELSATRHNRARNQHYQYRCNSCKQVLQHAVNMHNSDYGSSP